MIRNAFVSMLADSLGFCLFQVAVLPHKETSLQLAGKPLPFVSPVFGDNMVLQHGKANTIWGWSEPGDKVASRSAQQQPQPSLALTIDGK